MSPESVLKSRYNSSRTNILLVVVFTAINIVLLMLNADTYFLFSAYIPYFIAGSGLYFTGKFPADYYDGDISQYQFYEEHFLYFAVAVATVFVILYLLSWIFSKKHVGWMMFALAFFSFDTIAMFSNGVSADSVANIIFHIWVIVSLSVGIYSYSKLRRMPASQICEGESLENCTFGGSEPIVLPNSPVIRTAAQNIKCKVFLSVQVNGHTVVYRRVKRVNELIIDENVYDQIEALVELPHVLQANLDGHVYKAGTDSTSHTFVSVDDTVVARKLRFI